MKAHNGSLATRGTLAKVGSASRGGASAWRMRSKLVVSLLVGCSGAPLVPPTVDLGTPAQTSGSLAATPSITFDYSADRVGDLCWETSKIQSTSTVGSSPPKLYEREQTDTYEVLQVENAASVKERFSWSRHSTRRNGVEDAIPIALGTQYLMSLNEKRERQAFDAQGGPLEKPLEEWLTGHWRVGVRDDVASALHGKTMRSGDAAPALSAHYRKQIQPGATLRSERYLFLGQEADKAKFSIELEADFRWESPGTFTLQAKLWLSIPRGTPTREETTWTIARTRRDGEPLRVEWSGVFEDKCEAR